MRRVRLEVATACAALGVLLGLAGPARAVIRNVDEASDVCSPNANPCTINQTVETVNGAVLDFGLRELRITGSGQINAGTGNVTVLCGKLFMQKSGTAIQLKGTSAFGDTRGGLGRFTVRRACSGDTSLLCVRDTQCAVASAGSCSVGSGDAHLAGKVLGTAGSPATFALSAAGDVDVLSTITVNGDTLESDGGTVEIDALGDLSVSARIQVTAGGFGSGGEVNLTAGGNVVVTDLIDATGGDFDGGFVEISAQGTVTITDDIKANSTSGEGFGGEIDIESGADMDIVGGGAANRLLITTDGHQSAENFGGDGGTQDYFAGGDLHIGRFVRMTSDGAPPDGFGESITIDAAGDILIDGEVQAKGAGGQSGGGEVDILTDGVLELSSTGKLDVTGADGGGGDVSVFGDGGVVIAGSVVASGSPQGPAGALDLESGARLTVSGAITSDGAASGSSGVATFTACDLSLTSSALIDNKPAGAANRFVAREQMTAAVGSDVRAGAGGSNEVFYRTNAKAPVLRGSISPAPSIQINAQLANCPVCGNDVIEPGETCDDGNGVGGDGCSAGCQDEGCIADTPGYPAVPLCSDGDNCTVDVCNTQTSSCDHSASCDDGIDCTVDACVGTTCTHTPDDQICNEANECALSVCTLGSGCVVTTPISGPCDDGNFCNGSDTCGAGQCSVHAGSPCAGLPECQDGCNEALQLCGSPFGAPCTSDGNGCTDNVCDGLGNCITLDNNAPCDDGVFCNGGDVCSEGGCSFHLGPPCVLDGECRDFCDESAGACRTPAGAPCGDDENVCTDDACDGLGNCVHVERAGPCEDGDFCTTADFCVAGECVASDGRGFSDVRVLLVRRAGEADDQFLVKGSFDADSLQGSPAEGGIRLEIRGGDAGSVYESVMPQGQIRVAGRASAPTFKFKDSKGLVPTANGVRNASVKHVSRKRTVRMKFRMKGFELGSLVDVSTVSLSILLGEDPATTDCVSGTALACTRKGVKLRCGG